MQADCLTSHTLLPSVVSYGEMKSGKRNAAIINAIMGLFFKIGFTLDGAIPLWFLAVFGFDGYAAKQTASALSGINITAIWIPSALAIVSMIVMALYPLSDKDVEDINKQLDASRAKAKVAK